MKRSLALLTLVLSSCTGAKGLAPPSSIPSPTGAGPTSSICAVPPTVTVSRSSFHLPAPVEREVAVASGGTIYLAGGLDAAGRSTDGVFAMDPRTGDVRLLGTLPQSFHDAGGALRGGRLFVFGGGSSSGTDVVQSFDLATRRGRVAGRLPTALSDLAAVTVGGTVYLVGGFDGTSPRREIYATEDGTSFRVVGRLPTGLRYAAAASIDGKVIVAGGISATGPVSGVWSFDPADGGVRSVGRLPHALGHAVALAIGGSVVVVGGADADGHALRSVSVIDPLASRVRRGPPLSQPVADPGAAVADGQGWVAGGRRTTTVADVLRVSVSAGC